ncbi:MAG: hypothetical protein JXA28_03470 [Bacteroidetes bacterium]|nr:hypothetical protein [Bacteroidota bacterium]
MHVRRILIASMFFLLLTAEGTGQTIGSWERIPNRSTFDLWDVTFTDSLNGCAVGDYGAIQRTTDGGRSWSQKLSPQQFALRRIHFFDDSTGIATGFHGSCVRTTDAGNSWQPVQTGTEATLPGLAAIGNTVWLSGESGIILKSTDRGITWKRLQSGTDVMLNAITFADASHGWASSVQRKFLRTRDGGATWTDLPLESFVAITDLKARSTTECWMAGYHGRIMRSSTAGDSWSAVDAYDTDYVSMRFDPRGRGWAVGKRGAIVRAEDDALVWRLHDLTSAASLNAIAFLPNNTAIAVGSNGAIYRLDAVVPPPIPESHPSKQ